MKFDKHGFITREWATINIKGFDEMDPCCQNLVTLFPDVPHACSDLAEISKGIPVTVSFPEPETIYPAAIIPVAAAVLHGGGSSQVNVPEPGTLAPILIGLAFLAWMKRR